MHMRADAADRYEKLFGIAREQSGYFTAQQARAVGYYDRLQHFHRHRGNWMDVERGVFRLRNYPDSPREDLVRWSLWSRNKKGEPQATISHGTAAVVHELGDFMPAQIHLTVPPSFRKKMAGGGVLHRAILSPQDTEQHEGFRVTTPLRTLRDLAQGSAQRDHLEGAVREALRKGILTKEQISHDDLLGQFLRS